MKAVAMGVVRNCIFLGLLSFSVGFRIGPAEGQLQSKDPTLGESNPPQLIRVLQSLRTLWRWPDRVRLTARQTTTDILENSIGAQKRGINGESSILPPWNEFCRMVKMRNCFSPRRRS